MENPHLELIGDELVSCISWTSFFVHLILRGEGLVEERKKRDDMVFRFSSVCGFLWRIFSTWPFSLSFVSLCLSVCHSISPLESLQLQKYYRRWLIVQSVPHDLYH